MRGDRDVGTVIARKYIIKHFLRPDILVCARLGVQSGPVGILLRKAFFKLVGGEVLVDVRFGAATIARVCRDALAEELLDSWHKWTTSGQIKTGEGQFGGVETAVQRAGVVRLRWGNLFVFDQAFPELVY